MEEHNCKNCKFFNDWCENFRLSASVKKKRLNGSPCEYWKERPQTKEWDPSLKRKLLDLAGELEKLAFSLEDFEK